MSAASSGEVGPNSVIQLGAALREAFGPATARRVFADAGLLDRLDDPPQRLISEREPAALFEAVTQICDPSKADAVLRDAGRRTADYVMRHRIPSVARSILAVAPTAIAGRLLLSAIKRNAWTFAGSGTVATGVTWTAFWIEIAENPLATRGCSWHQGVFTHLFRSLVDADLRVEERTCCADGATCCRFQISASDDPRRLANVGARIGRLGTR